LRVVFYAKNYLTVFWKLKTEREKEKKKKEELKVRVNVTDGMQRCLMYTKSFSQMISD
jgi:hypothetical protein